MAADRFMNFSSMLRFPLDKSRAQANLMSDKTIALKGRS